MPLRREGGQNQQQDKNNQKGTKRGEEIEHCSFCGKDGHNRDGCFMRIGYPEWWPGKTKGDKGRARAACIETGSSPIPGLTNEQYEVFVKHFADSNKASKEETQPAANMAGKLNQDRDWVVDSGATEHITYKTDLLENKRKFSC